jgi:hypothetical protein
MSLIGPQRTFCDRGLESAFGGKADIGLASLNVCF